MKMTPNDIRLGIDTTEVLWAIRKTLGRIEMALWFITGAIMANVFG